MIVKIAVMILLRNDNEDGSTRFTVANLLSPFFLHHSPRL